MVFLKLDKKKYSLTYFQVSSGSKAGIDRPFKIIEKNKFVKGRRKQNQISFNLDFIVNSLNKVELRVFQSKPIDLNLYENLKEENKILPEYVDEFKTNLFPLPIGSAYTCQSAVISKDLNIINSGAAESP